MVPMMLSAHAPALIASARTFRTPGTATGAGASNGSRQAIDSHGYHYTIVGNHALTRAEVAGAVTRGATPRAVVGALKQTYEQKGYFLVALVATRHAHDVTVHVVRGRITHVAGPEHVAAFFTGLEDDAGVRKPDVIRRAMLARAYAATNGKQLKISFRPAPETGGSMLDISQTPLAGGDRLGASLTFGNFGNRYAAHYLAQAQLTAQGDGLNAELDYTRALPSLARGTRGASYRATRLHVSMVTPAGVFALDGSATNYRLGDAFAPLFPAGRIRTFGATATQLAYADSRRRWLLHEGVHRIHDATTVFSGRFTLSDRRFNLLELGSNYSQQVDGLFRRPATVALSGAIKYGFAQSGWGFTAAPGAPASHFKIYTASVDLTQPLGEGYGLELSLSAQDTPATLPSYEQWVLGGVGHLTAYLRGTLAGDRGYLARLVGQSPEWNAGPLHVRFQLYAERGASRFGFIAPQAATWRALADVGASMNLRLAAAGMRAVLAWAKPVGSHGVSLAQRRGQRAHLFFSLRARF